MVSNIASCLIFQNNQSEINAKKYIIIQFKLPCNKKPDQC
jgi:hypothetical protein